MYFLTLYYCHCFNAFNFLLWHGDNTMFLRAASESKCVCCEKFYKGIQTTGTRSWSNRHNPLCHISWSRNPIWQTLFRHLTFISRQELWREWIEEAVRLSTHIFVSRVKSLLSERTHLLQEHSAEELLSRGPERSHQLRRGLRWSHGTVGTERDRDEWLVWSLHSFNSSTLTQ